MGLKGGLTYNSSNHVNSQQQRGTTFPAARPCTTWPTAAIDGFLVSPAGGWVTSAPKKITGSLKTLGLLNTNNAARHFVASTIITILVDNAAISIFLTWSWAQECCWHHRASRWSSSTDSIKFAVTSSRHSLLAHTGWRCRAGCLRLASLPLWPKKQTHASVSFSCGG